MDARRGDRGRAVARAVFGAVAGLVVAIIVTLNLHILVGLEEGYAATLAQVVEHSVLLAVFDLVLLVSLPVAGARSMRPRPRTP